jgi:hypothetical protein
VEGVGEREGGREGGEIDEGWMVEGVLGFKLVKIRREMLERNSKSKRRRIDFMKKQARQSKAKFSQIVVFQQQKNHRTNEVIPSLSTLALPPKVINLFPVYA